MSDRMMSWGWSKLRDEQTRSIQIFTLAKVYLILRWKLTLINYTICCCFTRVTRWWNSINVIHVHNRWPRHYCMHVYLVCTFEIQHEGTKGVKVKVINLFSNFINNNTKNEIDGLLQPRFLFTHLHIHSFVQHQAHNLLAYCMKAYKFEKSYVCHRIVWQ